MKYGIKPKADIDDLLNTPMLPFLQVDGPEYRPTGILTPEGDMIYTLPIPIGFGRDNEW